MYQSSRQARSARRFVDRPSLLGPQAMAASALARVRKLLNAYRPGLHFDPAHLRSVLVMPLADPAEETERLFALGWLNWVGGDLASTEALLSEAVSRAEQTKAMELLAAAAYWRARIRLLLKRAEAVAEYEKELRKLNGSPQATAWFVDLLWRAGKVDRAEQIWKTVRSNKRVAGCPDGPFLDVQALLHQGEMLAAEKLLNETTPTNGVLYVEKRLLLAWILAQQKQYDSALRLLEDCDPLPYPTGAVKRWRDSIVARRDGKSGNVGALLSGASAAAAGRLCLAARTLQQFRQEAVSLEALETWRSQVRQLRSESRLRGLAQALLLQEAAQRGDAATVGALIEEFDYWRAFRSGPPRFVLLALENIVSMQPAHPVWRRSLGRWLQLWDAAALGPTGATLAALSGSETADAATVEPPPGVPRLPWLLHLAVRAIHHDDGAALTYTRRALAEETDLAALAESSVVREALPELERRAAAHALAKTVAAEGATPMPAAVLADVVDQLHSLPDARKIAAALESGEARLGRKALSALAERTDLPPPLSHHLALIEQRGALAAEERDDLEAAIASWLRAWRHWLAFFAASPDGQPAQALLLNDLFAQHRRRLNDLLARNAIDPARRYWNLIQSLPTAAAKVSELLGRDLGERVLGFRDDLATDYLLTTREAMRYGIIPQGFHADYEKGLGFLRRLLSLDNDNIRLLTALVEVCNEWFLDLYNLGPSNGLREQVERFTPFALQLGRLVEDKPGDLAARAQLADFYKFRGFITREREQKLVLYREALRFNPGNDNVRNLLAELEKPADASTGDQ